MPFFQGEKNNNIKLQPAGLKIQCQGHQLFSNDKVANPEMALA